MITIYKFLHYISMHGMWELTYKLLFPTTIGFNSLGSLGIIVKPKLSIEGLEYVSQ